jgi:hypothetical protein
MHLHSSPSFATEHDFPMRQLEIKEFLAFFDSLDPTWILYRAFLARLFVV